MSTPTALAQRAIDTGRIVKSFDLRELKFSDIAGEEGTFTGIASAVGVLDRHQEVIEPGAFNGNDLSDTYVLLWQHDTYTPIGVVQFGIDGITGNLIVTKGAINLETQAGREAYALLKQGAVRAMSIGFNIPDGGAVWDEANQVVRILRVELWEVSLVTFPANPGAVIQTVKALLGVTADEAKAGKVLSTANLKLVEDAITALTALRDAATPAEKRVVKAADAGADPDEPSFDCPSCGTTLVVETLADDEAEDAAMSEKAIDPELKGHAEPAPELAEWKQITAEVVAYFDQRVRTDVR